MNINDKQEAAFVRLLTLKDGWDSYSAPRPNGLAISRAREAFLAAKDADFSPTAVIPDAMGGVALCWDKHNFRASLEFDNDGSCVRTSYGVTETDAPTIVEEFTYDDKNLAVMLAKIRIFLG